MFVNDRYMWATLPLALTLFLRGFIYLLVPDNILTAAASKIFILSFFPVEVSQIAWLLVGLTLALEAIGLVKPIWAQALVRGVSLMVLLDLELYANYITFFVRGTPFIVGALSAHWALTIVWMLALKFLPVRDFSIQENRQKKLWVK